MTTAWGLSVPSGPAVGRSQLNLGLAQSGGDYPFINALKNSQDWTFGDGSALPSADMLDSNGYPNTSASMANSGVFTVFFIPSQANRPGNWIIRWVGEATIFLNFSYTLVSGSSVDGTTSIVNGRAVITPTGSVDTTFNNLRIDFRIVGINTSNPPTRVEFIHADDEASYDGSAVFPATPNGAVFGAKFKSVIKQGNPRIIRFQNWLGINQGSNICQWSDRKPVDYYSYVAKEQRSSLYCTTPMTNSGNDYTQAFPGFVLADKATVIVKFNATANSLTPTININSTGAKTILDVTGDTPLYGIDRYPTAGKFATLTYDADLGGYIKIGGDSALGSCQGLINGVPIEIITRLCNELNVWPWLQVPHLAVDPPVDYATQAATYFKNNLNPGLIPVFEVSNEVWNFAFAYPQTEYGVNKANVAWGGGDQHKWYGRAVSKLGQDVSTVYGADRSKYRVVCAVWTADGSFFGSPADQDVRMTSAPYVAAGGGPSPYVTGSSAAAKNWVTHIALANYWGTNVDYVPAHPYYGTTQELADATTYSTADPTTQATLVAGTFTYSTGNEMDVAYSAFSTWATGYGVGMMAYEGGYSPDYGGNASGVIHAASKAAQCVLQIDTASYILPPVNSTVSISGATGMTSLNGGPYTVTAVALNSGTIYNVTINLDSSGFAGTYGADSATATYVNSGTLLAAFRKASKAYPGLNALEKKVCSQMLVYGGEYPSRYDFSGIEAFSVFDTDIYSTPSPAWDGITSFNS